MGTSRSHANQKLKDGFRNSTGLEEYEISGVRKDISKMRCLSCNRIPDKEIFTCSNGHLICDICKSKKNICAEAECTSELQRNALAEALLDDIKFKCPWPDCNENKLSRGQLTSHKNSCIKNPNFIQCSQIFECKCDNKFCTIFADDEEGIKNLKEHLLLHENDLLTPEFISGREKIEVKCSLGDIGYGIFGVHVFDWIIDLSKREEMGSFMSFWLVENNVHGEKTLSRYYISITEVRNVGYKVEVQMSISSQPKPESGLTSRFLPNLNWNTKVLNTREFKEILNLTSAERSLRNYAMPISHLQDYFVDSSGEVTLEFSMTTSFRAEKRKRT